MYVCVFVVTLVYSRQAQRGNAVKIVVYTLKYGFTVVGGPADKVLAVRSFKLALGKSEEH